MYLELTQEEKQILLDIGREKRFPIARLEMHNSEQDELVNIALNYVRITKPEDSMETVKARSAAIKSLMEQGLVFIDYTVRVWVSGDYDVYYKSKIYELLCQTVMEGAKQPNALFNLAFLRKGYATLTRKGEKLVEQL